MNNKKQLNLYIVVNCTIEARPKTLMVQFNNIYGNTYSVLLISGIIYFIGIFFH